jgi:hypothetical protein
MTNLSNHPSKSKFLAFMMKRKSKIVTLAAAACTLLLTNASQAAITITFTQSGPDVVATFSGSIVAPTASHNSTFTVTDVAANVAATTFLYYSAVGASYKWWSGAGTAVNHTTISPARATSDVSGGTTFAFVGTSLYLPSTVASGGTFTPTGSATWRNIDLATMDLIGFNDTIAYTLTGGGSSQTIRYTSVIPEPSTFCLSIAGLATLALLRRR